MLKNVITERKFTLEDMWQLLNDNGVSDETINVVTDINGYNEQTMCDILYVTAGYNDFNQYYLDNYDADTLDELV